MTTTTDTGETGATKRRTRYQERLDAGRHLLTVEVRSELYDALLAQSHSEERPMSAIIRMAVRDYLRAHPLRT